MDPLKQLAADAGEAVSDLLSEDAWEDFCELSDLQKIQYRYCHADCDDFALAMSEATGWPVMAVSSYKKGPIHRLVEAPDGRLLDIMGWVTLESLAQRYSARALNMLPGNHQSLLNEDEELHPVIATALQLPYSPFDTPDFQKKLRDFASKIGLDIPQTPEVEPLLLPEFLIIDDVPRPTTNSLGRPIHPTEEGVRNFWAWFGNSKCVDAEGRPLVVFHGSTRSFHAFDAERMHENDHGWYGEGVYLTADPDTASAYTHYANLKFDSGKLHDSPEGANVMACYVKLEHPYHWPDGRAAALDRTERDALTQEFKHADHDGIIVPNKFQAPQFEKFHEVIAFDPTQIKSALGNSGRFDPASPSLNDHDAPETTSVQNLQQNEPEMTP